MTEEGFRRYLRPFIEAGTPFCAYWHPRGFGLIKTGYIPTQKSEYLLCQKGKPAKVYTNHARCQNMVYKTKSAWMETRPVPGKPRKITEGTLKRWMKHMDRLRREYGGRLITVDFDGTNTKIGGEFEL